MASGVALHAALPGWARAAQTGTPSAPPPAIAVPPDRIAYLMADRALFSPSLHVRTDETQGRVKRFWVENWRQPEESFAWVVDTQRAGTYEVTLMISAPTGTPIQVEGPGNQLTFATTASPDGGFAWDRVTLPAALALPTGRSTVRIRLLQPVTTARSGAALKSIELLDTVEVPRRNARLHAFKSDTAWLNDAKFGFMTQCGEWSYPPHGPQQPWPAMADRFDVETFVNKVASTGAGYAVWSVTWATFFVAAPIQAVDAIMPGRTSKRDLIGEIADALHKRNIRFILYYHAGHDITVANGDWWSRNWVSPDDKTIFLNNWCAIVGEIGERYGDRLAGWMFDDELLYYPAPYERLGAAAKAGNKARILSYNPWIQARGTDFQDFQFGEGFTGGPELPAAANGIWPAGRMKGLHAHGNFQIDGPNWGINHPDTVIDPPRFTPEQAIQIAKSAAAQDIALSWNLLMYADGSVSEASLQLLQQVGRAARKPDAKAKF